MRKSHLIGALCAALFIFITAPANAVIVTFNYTGLAYDPGETFDQDPPAGSYTAANSVTGFFTVDDASLYDGKVITDFDILSWSFNDGRNTLSSANSDNLSAAQITYSGGIFTDWNINVQSPNNSSALALGEQWLEIITFNNGSTYAKDSSRIFECVSNCAPSNPITIQADSGSTGNTFNDGTGSWNVSPVPVPAAVWLFGSGLLGLIGIARRKKAA